MKQQNQAAIYLRWSNDDGRDSEATSIGTQRLMLMRYAKEHGIQVIKEFLDDGYSGTTMDRPGFQEMLSQIDDGKINCVLVKDMSRFGRNHIMVDMYVQMIFPEKGVRLISINDNYDSAKGESVLLPFMSIINEYYARDISKKLQSAHRVHAQQGQFLGRMAPFGYKKDPNDCHRLIVDEGAAEIVKMMFNLFVGGMSYGRIASYLHDHEVPNPIAYNYRTYGKEMYPVKCNHVNYPYNWQRTTIQHILTNPVYLGHTIGLKTYRKSFGVKKRNSRPEKDRVIVENTHESIIEQSLYDEVQRFASLKQRINRSEQDNMYKGILFCADCGLTMTFNSHNGTGFYRCTRYRYGKNNFGMFEPCTQHHTSLIRLNAYVLGEINKLIAEATDPIAFHAMLADRIPEDTTSKKKSLKKLQVRDNELKRLIKRVFEQNTLGVIDDISFSELYNGYKEEQNTVTTDITKLETELNATNKREVERMRLFGVIESLHGNQTELTRELLTSLIERMEVHEPVGAPYEKNKPQQVDIKWRFH
ncbi:recombinase [Clostridia bacterium]|nr:recombinase [Clostridia bacterium]